jgi:hypothetical protein
MGATNGDGDRVRRSGGAARAGGDGRRPRAGGDRSRSRAGGRVRRVGAGAVRRADRRMGLRLTVGLLATAALGVPFLLLALLVRAKWGPLIRLDRAVADALHEYALRNRWLVRTLEAVSVVLGPYVLRPLVSLVAIGLLARRHVRLGSWMLVAVWGSALLGVALKEIVGRGWCPSGCWCWCSARCCRPAGGGWRSCWRPSPCCSSASPGWGSGCTT